MKVNLVFPPYWSFQAPYLALPALAGHLRARGVATRSLDLNVLAVDRLLTAHFIDECVRRIEHRLAGDPAATGLNGAPLAHFLVAAEVVKPRLVGCKEVIRRDWDPQRVGAARSVVDHTMEIVSAAFMPSSIDRFRYGFRGRSVMDMALALELSEDHATNIFGAVLGERDVAEVLAGNPDLVGLSLTGLHQLVPTLTLIRRLKAAAPDVPIVLGGAMVLYLHELAVRRPELFTGVDFLVVGEGETPLVHLLDAVSGNRPMEQVENLLFRRGDTFAAGKVGHAEDVQQLGPPDFDGIPWEKYLSPIRIVPYLTSRGCYWDKCAFCSLCATYLNKYRQRSVEKVIADLRHLSVTEGVGETFFFTDECFSPHRLRAISRALLDADLKIEWDILARFEKAFRAEDFALAADAGLNWITWGLESASPRLLALMNKGIQPEEASRLLREVDDAGIWNNIFVFFGFPGETDEDYEATKSFVRENKEHIDSLSHAEFRLEKGAAIHHDWKAHGIALVDTADTFIGPVFPFEYQQPANQGRSEEGVVPRWLRNRVADFETFLLRETVYSRILHDGMTPANLKAALSHHGGKAGVQQLIEARARYFRSVFFAEGWHRDERFGMGPHQGFNVESDDADVIMFVETTGKIVALHGGGGALLKLLGEGASLAEALRVLKRAAPTEQDFADVLPFVEWVAWCGLLQPTGAGVLPPYPTSADVLAPI